MAIYLDGSDYWYGLLDWVERSDYDGIQKVDVVRGILFRFHFLYIPWRYLLFWRMAASMNACMNIWKVPETTYIQEESTSRNKSNHSQVRFSYYFIMVGEVVEATEKLTTSCKCESRIFCTGCDSVSEYYVMLFWCTFVVPVKKELYWFHVVSWSWSMVLYFESHKSFHEQDRRKRRHVYSRCKALSQMTV